MDGGLIHSSLINACSINTVDLKSAHSPSIQLTPQQLNGEVIVPYRVTNGKSYPSKSRDDQVMVGIGNSNIGISMFYYHRVPWD
ncbi:hypothetical protein ABKN59_011824 [Abortiporus biennis]